MNIIFNGKEARVEFIEYKNGNTGFKIYDSEGKKIISPTVDIGYKMNKEYVTIKNKDMLDTIGKMLQDSGVLDKRLDGINLEHSGGLSIYILTKLAIGCL